MMRKQFPHNATFRSWCRSMRYMPERSPEVTRIYDKYRAEIWDTVSPEMRRYLANVCKTVDGFAYAMVKAASGLVANDEEAYAMVKMASGLLANNEEY